MDERRSFFETLASEWDERQPPNRTQVLYKLLAPFAYLLETSGSILDVGTGTGEIIPILQDLAPSACLVSIDSASEMLQRAHQRCPDANLLQADVHQLPITSNHFDFILCHNSYAHFADKFMALCRLKDVLAPGGSLLILHDLSRERINQVHLCANAQIIHGDLLPEADLTRELMEQAGFIEIHTWDSNDRYAAIGTKVFRH